MDFSKLKLNGIEYNVKDDVARDSISNLINNLNIVNVKDFGAIGDGIYDDTTALQNAINSLVPGDTLYIPKGEYKITPQQTYTITGYGNYKPYYGLYVNNKNDINIVCEGTLKPDISINVMNVLAIQNCKNVNVRGIKGVYSGTIPSSEEFLQVRSLVHVNSSSNIHIDDCYSENVGGCVVFVKCTQSYVENSKGTRTSADYKSGTLFGCYASTECTIKNCICYGGTNDGDISIFGTNGRCSVLECKLFNIFEASGQIVSVANQGICIDSESHNTIVSKNYVYGYYYGIDVKTGNDGVIVTDNVVFKNKVGIAVRMGEGNAPTLNTLIANNMIHPNGGNGSTVEYVTGFTTYGMLIENAFGVNVVNNVFANRYNQAGNFVPIYIYKNKSYDHSNIIPTNINNNQFILQSILGSTIQESRSYAIYLAGTETQKLTNININDNTFKNAFTSNTGYTQPTIYGVNLSDCNIQSNIFTIKATGNAHIKLVNCTYININNNRLNKTLYNSIVLENVQFAQITGNNIDSCDGYNPAVNLKQCKNISLKDNQYVCRNKAQEGHIVACDSCDYILASGNTGYTTKNTFLANINASTNLVVDETNVYWVMPS